LARISKIELVSCFFPEKIVGNAIDTESLSAAEEITLGATNTRYLQHKTTVSQGKNQGKPFLKRARNWKNCLANSLDYGKVSVLTSGFGA
jgi:hypothetical protein